MSLYYVQHKHALDACPARDPAVGQGLMDHLDRKNASRHGVNILAEAVLDGKHSFVLIVEADAESALTEFMKPFAMAGSVEVLAASTCEAVVERMGCEPTTTG